MSTPRHSVKITHLDTATQRPFSRWSYVLVGFVLFLAGATMSIVTLLTQPTEVAVPQVFVETAFADSPLEFGYGPQPKLSHPDFFAETKEAFISAEQTFIEADLEAMIIRFFEQGVVTFEAPILSKGRKGSWWETPAGLYAVQTKSTNHLSSFGGVYQPWSMVFQGNFFIHGWPYYPDGTPVASQYSGGCIRLDDNDAKALYEKAKVGVPVLVYETGYQKDDFTYDTPLPPIKAASFLVADIQNGTILAESGMSTAYAAGPVTHLMVALIAAEYLNLDSEIDTVAVEDAPATDPVQGNLRVNAYSLLLPLLVTASDNAALTLASRLGRERAIALMNQKAQSIGMVDTSFVSVSATDPLNVSTNLDLLRLLSHLHTNRSFILRISTGERVPTAYDTYSFGDLESIHTIAGIEGFKGGAIGRVGTSTDSGVVLLDVPVKGQERPIAFIVLNAEDAKESIRTLHRYVVSQFGRR